MTVVQETLLVAGREVRRNLRSAKGIVLLALIVLGGTAVALVMAWVRQLDMAKAAAKNMSPEQIGAFQEQALTQLFGDPDMGKYLGKAPAVLLFATLGAIWFAPALIALVGFDSVPTDLQHRGIRYFTVRINRASYYVGKLLGLWAVVSLMMLLSSAFIWVVALVKGAATAGDIAAWGPRFWLVTVAVTAAWCGIAQLVASQFRVPILALLVTFATFFVLWIVNLVGRIGGQAVQSQPDALLPGSEPVVTTTPIHSLIYLYPNNYDHYLLSPSLDRIAIGLAACVAFLVLTGAAGAVTFARRDL